MSIKNFVYRTKTYIAGDWTGDKDAIDQLHKWNDSDYWGLSFVDVHSLTQSNDNSLNCSIKKSLKERMDISKTFILVVGDNTKNLRSGACYLCDSYSKGKCKRGYSVDNDGYVEYECQKAIAAKIKIVVLYNGLKVDREKCPDIIKNYGTHIPLKKIGEDMKCQWDYQAVKKAIMN